MLIEIVDYKGRTHFIAPSAIAKISEASTSSSWHGIRAFVKTFDGDLIEARETPQQIAKRVNDGTS